MKDMKLPVTYHQKDMNHVEIQKYLNKKGNI